MKLPSLAFSAFCLTAAAFFSGCNSSNSVAVFPSNSRASNSSSESPTPQPSPTPDSKQKKDAEGISAEEQKPLNELAERCKHAPIGKAKVTPLSGKAPLTVTFDGSSSYDPDGTKIVSWRWLFGDGVSKNGRKVTHTFEKPGTFGLGLVVTDQQDQKSSDCGTGALGLRVIVSE